MLKGSADKYMEDLGNGSLYTNYVRGAELKKLFDTAIKYNRGLYKSDDQSIMVDRFIEEHGTDFSYEVSDCELQEDFNVGCDKTQYRIIVGGRYTPPGSEMPVPICSIYIVDYLGVVKRYKCRFTCHTHKRYLKDFELLYVDLNWSRDTNQNMEEGLDINNTGTI